jgi:RNA polymerase sigma-70 factor, ECF subfamily
VSTPSDPRDTFPELAAARAGEDAALGRLLDGYRSYLLLLSRVQIGRRLRGKADPADLVQDTFLEAHRAFPHFRGETEAVFLAWLRRILARQTARLVRRYGGTQARDVDLERTVEQEIDSSSDLLDRGLLCREESPSGAAARREQAVILAEALDRLPPDYRETIILRQLEGLTFDEVAGRLGRSVDAVQKLWVRGLDQLRRQIEWQG